MNNNNFITALFEEIKSQISVIAKELEKDDTPRTQAELSAKKEEKSKTITTEELLSLIQKAIIYSTKKEFQQAIPLLQNSKKELLEGINDLHIDLKNLKCYPNKNKKNTEINNFKLWKIGSIIVFMLLLFCVIVLKVENYRLSDNDLKFRYIHSNRGVNSTDLQNIETIFHISKNKELIKSMRKDVEEYELKAKEELVSKETSRNPEQ
ncbi:MAG: hypothetical protein JXR82_03785 [Marinifilaceae bacterium]|nr:hypothetical protein [Marinifilaceae bacterium]